ncbi:nucleotide sugar dehydrogenase [Paenibacillus silvisoli]|uniref:nucleotide sugar dehydrogenase n=1 Tax=Paenibacillus silvisoli TaxID=3110539 RepID=UPI00280398C3|nr:nucleotide sugar dehydrogenase [Paenibacillus silvisoli]
MLGGKALRHAGGASFNELFERKLAKVAVIGLGYVGLAMSVEMAIAGYEVHGIDIDEDKIKQLQSGHSYIAGIEDDSIRSIIGGSFFVGSDYCVIAEMDVVIICVPTPLTKEREPDITYIQSAVNNCAPFLRDGTLVILESTTYPGTTDKFVTNVIEEKKQWKAGNQFYACYSPERVDPGNTRYTIANCPKIVGGTTPACLEAGMAFYASFIESVIPVSQPSVAETAKLFENTFRSVNIALVNELLLLCEMMNVNVWEVLEAAATKPFGYMPFVPGPGIGGHCIPIDPLYLHWKAKSYGHSFKMIELADESNRRMPAHVIERITDLLNARSKAINGSRITFIGAAYKKNVNDLRESPALEIMARLLDKQANVRYHDPFIPNLRLGNKQLESIPLKPESLEEDDLVIITTDHTGVDYDMIVNNAPLVFDTRNIIKRDERSHVFVLGDGR